LERFAFWVYIPPLMSINQIRKKGGLYMHRLFEKRRSVREYKARMVDQSLIKNLMETIKMKPGLVEEVETEFVFLKEGKQIHGMLDGQVGYYGKLIQAPHYFAVLSENKKGSLMNAGYMVEQFNLLATDKGLGTCTIEVPEDTSAIKEVLGIGSGMDLMVLLALGYPKKERKVSNIYDTMLKGSLSPLTELGYPKIDPEYSKEPVSSRLAVDEIVFDGKWGEKVDMEELQKIGVDEVFYYMRLAPSWGNRQPWRFILDDNRIALLMKSGCEGVSEKIEKIESGIAMLYLELAMAEKGMAGSWSLDGEKNNYKLPDDYYVVGHFGS